MQLWSDLMISPPAMISQMSDVWPGLSCSLTLGPVTSLSQLTTDYVSAAGVSRLTPGAQGSGQ